MSLRVLAGVLAGAWAVAEIVEAVASRTMVGDAVGPAVVVVPGFRNEDSGRINGINRWRVEVGLRTAARFGPEARFVVSGGDPAGAGVTEAAHLARELRRRGFAGEILQEDRSRTTWENAVGVVPLLAGAGRVAVASQPLHGLKLRLYLARVDPALRRRFVTACDYRLGELGPGRIITALIGVGDLLRVGTRRMDSDAGSSGHHQWLSRIMSSLF